MTKGLTPPTKDGMGKTGAAPEPLGAEEGAEEVAEEGAEDGAEEWELEEESDGGTELALSAWVNAARTRAARRSRILAIVSLMVSRARGY